MVIILQYQTKYHPHMFEVNNADRYEVKTLTFVCDNDKSDRENLDDAFDKACTLGCDPNKAIRWKFIG